MLSLMLFQIICIQIYLGHDLDLSRSRDVIDNVTIRFAVWTDKKKKLKQTVASTPLDNRQFLTLQSVRGLHRG